LKDVYVHCFFDGRDVPPDSAMGYVEELENKIREIGVGEIATVMGRYYAMDRDNRWERVKLAYDAMVLGRGNQAQSAKEAVAESYKRQEFDEFVKPTVIMKNGSPVATVGENDSIIFFNFRPDRAREITRAFTEVNFSGFERVTAEYIIDKDKVKDLLIRQVSSSVLFEDSIRNMIEDGWILLLR